MKSEDIYVQAIYSQVREIVSRYRQKLAKELKPQVPSNKKRVVKSVRHGKTFIKLFQKEDEIPDEFFIRYFDLKHVDDEIYAEIKKYIKILKIRYTIGEIDIMDLVSNPKTNGMTYIESLNRLYDKRDSVDYEERTFTQHMANLKRNWIHFNEKTMCLWASSFDKIGDKLYISNANGSHLTCLCKLIRLSGLSDEDLDMPNGFVKSLGSIRTMYRNTPDDLEFILMFNRMFELVKNLYPGINFYLKSSEKRGINVIGIEGTDIELSTVSDILSFLKTQPLLKNKTNIFENSEHVPIVEITAKSIYED